MHKLSILLLVFGLWAPRASSQTSQAKFPLRRVIANVLQKNPGVLAAEKSYSAAKARLLAQRPLLADPVFVAEYDGLSKLRPNFRGFGERLLGFGQQIEFPLKWWMRNDIASKDAQVAKMDFEMVKLEKIAAAKRGYGQVLTAERQRQLAEENLALAQDFLKKAKVRFDAGDVPRIEVLRAEIEVAKAESDTLQAGKNLLMAKASLNLLMARSAHAPLQLTDALSFAPVHFDMKVLKRKMMANHPRLKAFKYAVAGSRSAVRLSAMNFIPDLELGISRQTVNGEGNFWVAEIGFDIPLWFLFRQRGDLQEAKANLALAQAERISVQNELILGLENAYHQLHVAEKQVHIYTDKLLQEAEEAYRIASRSYEEGEASYLEVLEAQRTLRTTRTEYVQALFEYHSALAELEVATGGELMLNEQ